MKDRVVRQVTESDLTNICSWTQVSLDNPFATCFFLWRLESRSSQVTSRLTSIAVDIAIAIAIVIAIIIAITITVAITTFIYIAIMTQGRASE